MPERRPARSTAPAPGPIGFAAWSVSSPTPARPRSTTSSTAYRPWDDPPADRPRLALNFATTLDGRASIDGRSGAIGSDTDTAMLVGLRQRFDAVMIGAGTMRVEKYGRIVSDPARAPTARSSACPATRWW